MSSVSSFLSFVSNWIIWESAIMSWPSMKLDDIIGTLDKMAETTSVPFDVTIVSGDKDLIQLTDDNTVVEISKKGWRSLKNSLQPI